MTRLTIFSLFILSACATRPDANICVVNAPAGHAKCYNLYYDYNDKGNLLKSAKPTFKPAKSVYDLNKGVWMSNDDWAKVKVWIQNLRQGAR